MNEFFTWTTLGSFAGATAAVVAVTQLIKWLWQDKISGWITRVVSFAVALAVLYLAAFFTGTLDLPTAVITVFNAILVTLAAHGLYNDAMSVKK